MSIFICYAIKSNFHIKKKKTVSYNTSLSSRVECVYSKTLHDACAGYHGDIKRWKRGDGGVNVSP